MVYPAFPTGATPVFLDPFDWLFMSQSIDVIINPTGSPNNLNTGPPIALQGGGGLVDSAPWVLTGTNTPCPMWAVFGWSYEGISQGGNAVHPFIGHPQRVGPRFAWICIAQGGNPVLS